MNKLLESNNIRKDNFFHNIKPRKIKVKIKTLIYFIFEEMSILLKNKQIKKYISPLICKLVYGTINNCLLIIYLLHYSNWNKKKSFEKRNACNKFLHIRKAERH